ncbi:MAG: hypothetical protein HYX75_08720 [Acidobacteria bacterium]|nr:hypothetical protein [Acidobacteriota bacterium]
MRIHGRYLSHVSIALTVASVLLMSTASPQRAHAVTSFSRMYNMGCTACHTTMPRLNYFGEKLLLRGNELDRMTTADLPQQHGEVTAGTRCTSCHNDGSEGEEVGAKKISPRLFLHKVSNLLSFRYKLTPLSVETNKLTEGGEKKTRVTAGKGDWVQFWVAGPITKNVTVRVEAELAEGKSVGLHNYAVAFSNLLGAKREGALNLRVGGFTHGEWLSISDQKRAFAPHFDVFELASARGSGEDAYKVAGAEPAVELYGYQGPFVYQVGVSNGKSASDVNSDLNYWGTAKLYLATQGAFAGSSVSASYSRGTDSKNSAQSTIQKDDFRRYIISGGLRRGPLDLAGAYVRGEDDNWDLATGLQNQFDGGFVQLLYTATDQLTPGFIYQRISSDDKNFEKHHLLMGVNYYLRQNIFFSTYYDHDLRSTSPAHPDRQHAFVVQFRGMF